MPNARARNDAKRGYAALIVAAGSSSRLGRPKGLLPWRGESLLEQVVGVARASRCARVFVVLGAEAVAHERVLGRVEVTIVQNPSWRQGIGTSIAAGVEAMDEAEWAGVVLLLCDQPFVGPALVDALIAAREAHGAAMAACRYADTLGPPAVFDAALFGALRRLDGDRGAKALLLEDPSHVAQVEFPDGAFDIDSEDDYARALARLAEVGASGE